MPDGSERCACSAADRFDQLLSLSAETLVAARQLASWGDVLDRSQHTIGKAQQMVEDTPASSVMRVALKGEVERQLAPFAIQVSDFYEAARANERTAERLYGAVLGSRLRQLAPKASAEFPAWCAMSRVNWTSRSGWKWPGETHAREPL